MRVQTDQLEAPPVTISAGRPASRFRHVIAARRNYLLLGSVAIGYLLAQFIIVTPRKYLGWDESLYVSQFAPGIPAGYMSAPRAFGMPLLAAPVVALTPSVALLRLYLMAVSSAGLYCAFWPWLKIRDTGAVPLAALLFSGVWLSIFYGNELMPNVYTACCVVAATGCFVLAVRRPAWRRGRAWGPLAGLVAAFAAMSLIRPLDAVWALLPLGAAALLHRRWRRVAPLVAILAGAAVGWVPWVVEAYVRFGGLLERFAEIDKTNAGGLQFVVLRQLQSFSSGNLMCGAWQAHCGGYTAGAVLMWCVLPVLVALGLLVLRRTSFDGPGLLATGVAVFQAGPYLFLTGHANPRYLLPAYALAFLPAAAGLHWLAGRCRRLAPVIGPALVPALVIVFLADQLAMATAISHRVAKGRHKQLAVGRELVRAGVRPPCLVYGTSAPQIAHVVHCRYKGLLVGKLPAGAAGAKAEKKLTAEAARGTRVAVVGTESRPGQFLPGWRRVRVGSARKWTVLVSPPQAAQGSPPQASRRSSAEPGNR